MANRLAAARATAQQRTSAVLADLERWLRIPSISGDPAHRTDVTAAAGWIARRLSQSADCVRVVSTTNGPVVLARVRGTRPGGPPIVVYGHLDVKAAGPGWTSKPFEPLRRGGLLFARGASDDKGQLMAHVAALEAWHSVGGPPTDVVVIVDGAEEIGSPGLMSALTRPTVRDILLGAVTAIVVSDTRMVADATPSLTVSQRGVLNLSVRLSTGHHAVHAGRYGGAVIDPTVALATSIVRATRAARALSGPAVAHSPTDADIRAGSSGRVLYRDRVAARATTRGALTVTSFDSGSAPGSIPPAARATLDVRLPPGMEPAPALRLIAGVLRSNVAENAEMEITCVAASAGSVLRQERSIREAIDKSCCLAYGHRAVAVASGGSIPAVGMLAHAFSKPPILLGLGPSDDGAHGPDERINMGDWAKGVDACVCLLGFLADGKESKPR